MALETSLFRGNRAFPSTRWTLVLRARQGAAGRGDREKVAALGDLISAYWQPLYCFVRRKRAQVEDAKDLTQAFFATLLEKDFLKSADREKGRFRTFLLTAFDRFLANEYDKQQAAKRGGNAKMMSLDFDSAEARYTREAATDETPERRYLREWARAITFQALDALRNEFARKGKADLFDAIKPHLGGGEGYANLAPELGMSAGNLKVIIHRARKRYAELLRLVVRDTVRSDEDVEAELKELLNAM